MSNSSFIIEIGLVRNRLASYYLPPIFVFGIIGNILNIIIFSRSRLRENVVSWYFICLSICQILFLFYNCLYRIITTGWNNGYDLAGTIVALCKFRAYGFILWLALSRHFLCLISLDRWMKTSRNVTIREKSSPKYAKRLIIISFIFWCLFSLHGPIGYNIISTNGCTSMVGGSYQLLYTIHTIFIGIIPFLFMIILGFLTLKNIRKRNQINIISLNNSNNQQRQKLQTDFQLIRLTIYQTIFFLIFNSISSINPIYTYSTNTQLKSSQQRAIDSLISDLGLYLVHTYMSLTFLLYTLASSTFRKESKETFKKMKNLFIRIF